MRIIKVMIVATPSGRRPVFRVLSKLDHSFLRVTSTETFTQTQRTWQRAEFNFCQTSSVVWVEGNTRTHTHTRTHACTHTHKGWNSTSSLNPLTLNKNKNKLREWGGGGGKLSTLLVPQMSEIQNWFKIQPPTLYYPLQANPMMTFMQCHAQSGLTNVASFSWQI